MYRAGANSCHTLRLQDSIHGTLRSRCHRHRSGRLCLRGARGAARHEGCRSREDATLGGTCLNVGCMPSKALLHASEMFEEAGHSFAKMGVSVAAPKLDLPAMMNFKQQGIDGNVKGVEFLMKKNKIDVIHGKGKILGAGKVEVSGADGKTQLVDTKNVVIATGSDIARLKGIEIDEKRIVSSTGALSLDKVPGKLLIVGA